MNMIKWPCINEFYQHGSLRTHKQRTPPLCFENTSLLIGNLCWWENIVEVHSKEI